MFLDCCVTIALLLIFKDNIVNLIAASNIGYITVFILLSPAYIALRRRQPNLPRPYKLPGIFVPIAAAVFVFNVVITLIGAPQLGASVVWTRVIIMLGVVPFYPYPSLSQDRRRA